MYFQRNIILPKKKTHDLNLKPLCMFFCVFSKFIKWPQLNCQAGQFQSLGRMFNTPGLLVHGVLNIRGPAWDFSPGPLMDFENKIIHGHFMFTKCFVKLYFVKYEDLSNVKTMTIG